MCLLSSLFMCVIFIMPSSKHKQIFIVLVSRRSHSDAEVKADSLPPPPNHSLVPILQVYYSLWRHLLKLFWWLVVAYTMLVLISIYTYQFEDFPEYWKNLTGFTDGQYVFKLQGCTLPATGHPLSLDLECWD